jgi:hypothetical protein
MLKLIDYGLLFVTLLIVLGLVLTGPPEAPPVEEDAIGAAKPADEVRPKAS